MNDVRELKQFAEVHARAQNIKGYRDVLTRIDSDEDGAAGSWAAEWTRAGDGFLAAGHPLEASRRYAMARFPFVDGTARRVAAEQCVDAFEQWAKERTEIERVDVDLTLDPYRGNSGRVRCWATGLSTTDPRPLLLLCGGIVSVKEQWAPILELVQRFGMAGIVAELPGVGENTLIYGPEGARMLSGILDAIADRADVDQTYAVAHSFSGHLALRCATRDSRIRGVVTTGAPVRSFFADRVWQARIPRITTDTLLHLTGGLREDLGSLADRLRPLALTGTELESVRVPVAYLRSTRDEIIPQGEVELLRRHVRDVRVVDIEDVHAAPHHVAESRLWTVVSVLRMRDIRTTQSFVVTSMWKLLRARRRLMGALT